MKIKINYSDNNKLPEVAEKQIKFIARELLQKEGLGGAKVNIIWSDDTYLESLNYSYRQKSGPTDVISFPLTEPEKLPLYRGTFRSFMLGEIYISRQRVFHQSHQRGVSFLQELRRLSVHGLFHLLGYEHSHSSSAWRMRISERKFLRWVWYRLLRKNS